MERLTHAVVTPKHTGQVRSVPALEHVQPRDQDRHRDIFERSVVADGGESRQWGSVARRDVLALACGASPNRNLERILKRKEHDQGWYPLLWRHRTG